MSRVLRQSLQTLTTCKARGFLCRIKGVSFQHPDAPGEIDEVLPSEICGNFLARSGRRERVESVHAPNADQARDHKALELAGEFAVLNFPKTVSP